MTAHRAKLGRSARELCRHKSEPRDIGLLLWMVRSAAESASSHRRAEHLRLESALLAYELSFWRREAFDVDALRQEVLWHLLHAEKEQKFFGKWALAGSWIGASTTGRRCVSCDALVKTFVAALRIPGVVKRRFVVCPTCDLVEDVPEGVSLTLSVQGARTLVLGGPLPRTRWAAGVVSDSWGSVARWRWPSDRSGAPMRAAVLPAGASHLPTRVDLYFVHELRVMRLVARVRGDAAVPDVGDADAAAGLLARIEAGGLS